MKLVDVVAGDRSRRLEGGRRESRQIEPGLLARIAPEQAREATGEGEPATKTPMIVA